MGLKLRKEKKEVWTTEDVLGIDEDEPKPVRFLISYETPDEKEESLTKNVDVTWDRNQRFERPESFKRIMDRINTIIRDWDGIAEDCNYENKKYLFLYQPKVIDRLIVKSEKLAANGKLDQEEEEKNLKSGPRGKATPKT